MLLSKVRHTENTPDTEKTFTFMLGLDETEKSPGSKVEMKLFPAHSSHCPPWELTSCSLQHPALPAVQGGCNASWCQWPHKTLAQFS